MTSPKELRQKLMTLDRETRRYVERAVRRGEAVSDRDTAQLVVEVARSRLRMLPWFIGLLIASIVLGVIVIGLAIATGRTELVVFRAVTLALAIAAVIITLRWRNRVREAETKNSAFLEQTRT